MFRGCDQCERDGSGRQQGPPGLTIRIYQDETGGIHALQDSTPCGKVRCEEVHETGTGVDKGLHNTSLEPDRLPIGLATVPDEHRDVQVTACSSSPRSRRPGKDHDERIGKTVTRKTSSLADGVWGHASQDFRNLVSTATGFSIPTGLTATDRDGIQEHEARIQTSPTTAPTKMIPRLDPHRPRRFGHG